MEVDSGVLVLGIALKETDVRHQAIAAHVDMLCGIVTGCSLAYGCRFFLPPGRT